MTGRNQVAGLSYTDSGEVFEALRRAGIVEKIGTSMFGDDPVTRWEPVAPFDRQDVDYAVSEYRARLVRRRKELVNKALDAIE